LGLAPRLSKLGAPWAPDEFPLGADAADLFQFLVVGGPGFGGPYQLVSMVFFAAVGILLARHVLPTLGDVGLLAAGLAFGVVSAVWIGLHETGTFAMAAYDVTHRVLVFDAMLIVAIALVVAGLAGRWAAAARPLATMGAMSLTLYCLQIVWLDADLRVFGHASDDTWRNVAVLVLGSAAVALAWRAVVRGEPWRRGPLEGPIALVIRIAR
jgi:peptidoglycan/LPS O-acetylase OafA/YrhL